MFEAVILDLDGLLVDSERWHLAAWNEYLKPFGHELEEYEAVAFTDRRDFENAEILRRRFVLPEDPLTMAEKRQEIFLRMAEENIEALPAAVETVRLLREYELRLAVISAGVREYIYTMIDKLEIGDEFDVIVAGDMIDVSKPQPMPFLACAETFALHPSSCLVLEDTRNGVEAAINAGMRVICVPSPNTQRWRISGADVVLNSLDYINLATIRSLWDRASREPQPQLQPQPEIRPRPFRRF